MRFIIKNAGMDTEGSFSGLQGEIRFNPADLKSAYFSVSIDAASVNTDIVPRDKNLREKEYLDATAHPRINFLSKQVTLLSKAGSYLMKGTITLKGISRDISFPFQVEPYEDGVLFKGEMKLDRRNFNIGLGSLVLSNGVSILLSVPARKM